MPEAIATPSTGPTLAARLLRPLGPAATPAARFVATGICGVCGLVALFLPAGWTVFALIFVAYVAGGSRTLVQSVLALRLGQPDINVLMLAAALVAPLLGHWDEGVALLFLFSLSDALEAMALNKTRRSIDALMKLRPDTAQLVDGGGERTIPVESLRIGDRVRVRPGERYPVDGTVIDGAGAADESIVTGEPLPVDKQPGSRVLAGTINVDGSLVVEVSALASQSTIARIVHLVEEARESKPPVQRVIERWQTPYVYGVFLLSIASFAGQWVLTWDVQRALYTAMTMLVAASPCAVVLATPVAILAAVTRGARHGVLFKGGAQLERLAGVQAIAFDKTGTLTRGKPVVERIEPLEGSDPDEVLRLAASLEHHSEHPLARAIRAAAEQRELTLPEVEEFTSEAGAGICGRIAGTWAGVGRRGIFESHGVAAPAELFSAEPGEGETTIHVWSRSGVGGRLILRDQPRPEAPQALELLRAIGISKFHLLTGDQPSAAARVAAELQIPSVKAGLRPSDKLTEIHRLAVESGGVAMVGDGVNDAPALAAATVGVAMGGGGSDVALETADVVLLRDDLRGLSEAIHLARHCRQTIRLSLAFAMGAIVVLVLLTLAGMMILPIAVIGHEGSTVLVILNGLRLLGQDDVRQHVGAAAPE